MFLYAIGRFLISENAIKIAKQFIMKLEKSDPENNKTLELKGFLFLEENDYSRALSNFKSALQKDSENASLMYNISCAFALLEDVKNSLDWLGKTIQNDPKFKDIAKNDKDFIKISQDKRFISIIQ